MCTNSRFQVCAAGAMCCIVYHLTGPAQYTSKWSGYINETNYKLRTNAKKGKGGRRSF